MKKLILAISIFFLTIGMSFAVDLSTVDKNTMDLTNSRSNAAQEIKAHANGIYEEIKECRAKLLPYKDTIGDGDMIILEGYVASAISFYQLLGTMQTAIENGYPCFALGICPEAE